MSNEDEIRTVDTASIQINKLTRVIGDPNVNNNGTLLTNQQDINEKVENIKTTISNFDLSLNQTLNNVSNDLFVDQQNNNQDIYSDFENKLVNTFNIVDDIVSNINDIKQQRLSSNLNITNKLSELVTNNSINNQAILTSIEQKIDVPQIINNTETKINNNVSLLDPCFNLLLTNKQQSLTEYINSIKIIHKVEFTQCKVNNSRASIMAQDSSFVELLNSLEITGNEQNNVIEFLGYIILPIIFEKRLIEFADISYKELQGKVICKIERLLTFFKDSDYDSLINEYSQEKQDIILNDIYVINKNTKTTFSDYITSLRNSLEDNSSCQENASNTNVALTDGISNYDDTSIFTLINKTQDSYNVFQHYIAWAYKTLHGLSNARYMYTDFNKLNNMIETYRTDSNILNDPEKLREWIKNWNETQNRSYALFETVVNFDITKVKLKPQYEEYIARHGVPNDFNFDMNKMAEIIYDLAQQGIMELSEVPNICSSNTDSTDGSISGDLLSTDTEEEKLNKTYFVYISSNDISENSLHNDVSDVYFYPLYLTREKALENVDIDKSEYNQDIQDTATTINSYNANDITDPSGVTKYVFTHLENIEFWQPNSHAYRSVGLELHPPILLKYVHYTRYTILSDIDDTCGVTGDNYLLSCS